MAIEPREYIRARITAYLAALAYNRSGVEELRRTVLPKGASVTARFVQLDGTVSEATFDNVANPLRNWEQACAAQVSAIRSITTQAFLLDGLTDEQYGAILRDLGESNDRGTPHVTFGPGAIALQLDAPISNDLRVQPVIDLNRDKEIVRDPRTREIIGTRTVGRL